MRTRINWSVVAPILETRMVGKLHEKACTLEILELWNPGPLVRPKCIEKIIRRHSFRGLGSKVEIIFLFKVPSRFSHYPSFQNGLIGLYSIIRYHFMMKNVGVVETRLLNECVISFPQCIQVKQEVLVSRYEVFWVATLSFRIFLSF